MASFVTGHFVDGIVDGIQAVLLGADGQIGLALSGAELAVRKSVRSGHFLRKGETPPIVCAGTHSHKPMPQCGIIGSLSMVVDATKMPHFGRIKLWQNRMMQVYFS